MDRPISMSAPSSPQFKPTKPVEAPGDVLAEHHEAAPTISDYSLSRSNSNIPTLVLPTATPNAGHSSAPNSIRNRSRRHLGFPRHHQNVMNESFSISKSHGAGGGYLGPSHPYRSYAENRPNANYSISKPMPTPEERAWKKALEKQRHRAGLPTNRSDPALYGYGRHGTPQSSHYNMHGQAGYVHEAPITRSELTEMLSAITKAHVDEQLERRDTRSSASLSSTPVAEEDEEELDDDDFPNPWAKIRYQMREPFAEFLGTAILIMFGDGVNNQVTLNASTAVSSAAKGDYTGIIFGWGVGVMAGVYVCGGVSGHINPAVTISLAAFRGFPWRKVPIFILAQVLGAMTGAAIVYGLYAHAIRLFADGQLLVTGEGATAALFATYSQPYMSAVNSFFQEFVDSAILLIVILAISDRNNTPPPDGMNPIVLLFLIVGIGQSLGSQTAYCINPARDLGPRLMTWIAGYGTEVWTVDSWYWIYVPICATISGALVGCFIYDLLIYTGGDSPLNKKWPNWRRRRGYGSHTKDKVPAGKDEPKSMDKAAKAERAV